MRKTLLVLGGSMTTAWSAVGKGFYDNIGVHPKITCWHAQAWRHKVNAPPYSIRDGALHFHDVTNNSVFFGEEDRHHPALGSTESISLNDVSGIVFTQPTTERGYLLELFKSNFFVHSRMPQEQFRDDRALSSNPLSREVYYVWWLSHQYHVSRFLEELTEGYPAIPVFITPEVLPRQDQRGYSREFREYYLMMMEVLMEVLRRKFPVLGCPQPVQTYVRATLATKTAFAVPPPDPHHYSPEYVRAIADTNDFRGFLTRMR